MRSIIIIFLSTILTQIFATNTDLIVAEIKVNNELAFVKLHSESGTWIDSAGAIRRSYLPVLETSGRAACYADDIKKAIDDIYGVYGIRYKSEIIGVHTVRPHVQSAVTCGYVMTDVLEIYRGLKFGTMLRKWVGEYFKTITCEKIPLSPVEYTKDIPMYLNSSNEWRWGKNGQSTKSSYNAGYRIVELAAHGLVQMIYPLNSMWEKYCWTEERTLNFLRFGMMCAQKIDFTVLTFTECFREILDCLDFDNLHDFISFLNIMDAVKYGSGDLIETEYAVMMDDCIQNYVADLSRCKLTKLLNYIILSTATDLDDFWRTFEEGANVLSSIHEYPLVTTFLLQADISALIETAE
jgi:hypothetical protein